MPYRRVPIRSGCVVHVTQRGHSRRPVFARDSDYLFYLECIAQTAAEVGVTVHAYVLMTNHVHLLLTVARDDGVARLMQQIGRRYVRYFNMHEGRSGSLWEGRFRACLIDSDAYLLACMRYIELNPVRAGLTSHPVDYDWSSFVANALGGASAVVRPHSIYTGLARTPCARRQAYRNLFSEPLQAGALTAFRSADKRRNVPNK